jgi:hypothetical protein
MAEGDRTSALNELSADTRVSDPRVFRELALALRALQAVRAKVVRCTHLRHSGIVRGAVNSHRLLRLAWRVRVAVAGGGQHGRPAGGRALYTRRVRRHARLHRVEPSSQSPPSQVAAHRQPAVQQRQLHARRPSAAKARLAAGEEWQGGVG